jgi:hypothetical protein
MTHAKQVDEEGLELAKQLRNLPLDKRFLQHYERVYKSTSEDVFDPLQEDQELLTKCKQKEVTYSVNAGL